MSDLADEQAEQDLLLEDLARLCIDERNPVEFYGQSGRLELDDVAPDAVATPVAVGAPGTGETFEGNSVLRGSRDG